MYITRKFAKLIHTLSKSAKQSWRLIHEALYNIYKGAILPLLLNGASVWTEAMGKNATKQYKTEYRAS